jgi:hypothetical protein
MMAQEMKKLFVRLRFAASAAASLCGFAAIRVERLSLSGMWLQFL